jgi:hypothetical protein
MRDTVKLVAHGLATIAVLPALVSYYIRSGLFGRDRALEGSSQALALIPGLIGDYCRRAFLTQVLGGFARSATVQFGTIFSQASAVIESGVYVGPRCHIGRVHIEKDVLLAAGVHIPSGPMTHSFGDLDQPIREQGGEKITVRIGEGSWIGSAAVVLADVGKHCIVGAGAVVTKPLPDYAVAAGVPARVIRTRVAGG